MFRGDKINVTEDRAVLHVALRAPKGTSIVVDGKNVVPEVHAVLDKMADVRRPRAQRRNGRATPASASAMSINIGIGGSDLGPVMAYEALKYYSDRAMTFRFVSNVDGTDFVEATRDLDPAETLFIISSKTFTTLGDDDQRAQRARLVACAASAAMQAPSPGISLPSRPMPKRSRSSASTPPTCSGSGTGSAAATRWTRRSVFRPCWRSARRISAPCWTAFMQIDEHFRTAPFERNLPVLMGLLASGTTISSVRRPSRCCPTSNI